jgi:cytochrome c5
VDKIESRTGKRAVMALIASALLFGLAGCSGNDAESMSAAEIDKLIAPVGQLNTGAPITMDAPAAAPADSPASTPAEAPAATPATPAPVTPAPVATARSGKQVYDSACFACHATGAAGAPKFGDKAAWAPRIAQGMDTLITHALNGFQGATGVMPPRGTCAACSDDELKAAITYMVDNAK